MAKQKPKQHRKSLKELKKSNDRFFRNRAKSESLLPTTDLNPEIRQTTKSIIGNKQQIREQQNKVKALEKENNRRAYQASKLRKEQYKKRFTDPDRVREIDSELKKPDYKPKDISVQKNYLKALQGKNFNFIVDDGFKKYNISTAKLKKYWAKGQDATILILENMRKHANEAIADYDKKIESEKKTATKAHMRKLNKIRTALVNKLKHTIEKNIEAMQTGDKSHLNDVNDAGEKAYSLLFRVVGFSIDRVGI